PATVRFRPPRSPEAKAGPTPFSIQAQSKAAPGVSASQDGILEVRPFSSASATLVPRTSRGTTLANYRLVLENSGNAPLRATLEGSDPDELLAITLDRPVAVVEPGQSLVVQVEVRPRAAITEGAPQ